jgi:hypothetical protein
MKIHTTRDIDAPASAVWLVLGEQFGEISQWFDGVVKSELDGELAKGATRVCDIKAVGPFPAGQMTETLSEFDRQKKVLTYVVETGGPPFLAHLQNRWVLEANDARSSIATSTVTYRLKWWAKPFGLLIATAMRKSIKPVFAQFRDAVVARYVANPGSPRPSSSQAG